MRYIRIALGYNAGEVARIVGRSNPLYSQIEAGVKACPDDAREAFEEHFRVRPGILAGAPLWSKLKITAEGEDGGVSLSVPS